MLLGKKKRKGNEEDENVHTVPNEGDLIQSESVAEDLEESIASHDIHCSIGQYQLIPANCILQEIDQKGKIRKHHKNILPPRHLNYFQH